MEAGKTVDAVVRRISAAAAVAGGQHGLVAAVPGGSVEVVEYSPAWPAAFKRERVALESAVGEVAVSVEHIGSTAVPGLSAKPTIDILMVVEEPEAFLECLPSVEALGYDYRANNTFVGGQDHLFLRKVADGKRTHHLHVLRAGSPEIDDYRLFRDSLRKDPELAAEYARVKTALAAEHAGDRMRYVTEKSDWVESRMTSLRSTGG